MPDNTMPNNSRIAKNTILLYIRMIVLMVVSLYTSRVILNSLGVEDFGVYNVVTGFVIAFGFLNSAMTASVQRFLTVEFKKDNSGKMNQVFNMSLVIHFFLAIIMVGIAEPIGLYFVQNKLVIPPERLDAAIWIFHFSVVTLFFSIMNVPYRSLIVTHEDMGAFAVISLFEAFAKLAAAFLIGVVLFDKLIFYGLLLAGVAIIVQVFYMFFCIHKYRKEVVFKLTWDGMLFKDMCSFAGWNLIGVFAGIAHNQGINIVLNLFGGPVVNAARAIAYQVSGAANQLVTNFQMAVNPPIMKSYVAKDGRVERLVLSSSKISYVLLSCIAIPAIIEAPYILKLWLKTVPEHAIGFTRLALIDAVVCSMAGPFHTLFQATGKIKLYQTLISGILLLNLPFSYLLLYIGLPFDITFVVSIALSLLALITRLILVRRYSSITVGVFVVRVLLPVVFAIVLTVIVPLVLLRVINEGFIRLVLVVVISIIILGVSIWFLVLDSSEKNLVLNFVRRIVHRK